MPLNWWRAWRARSKKYNPKGPPDIEDPSIPDAIRRDAGVEVFKVRLPSGAEVSVRRNRGTPRRE